MTFFVAFITLLLERFFDWRYLQRWNWYGHYQRMMAACFDGKPSYGVLAWVVIPLLIVVYLLAWSLTDVLFGLGEWLFQLALLFYCLGPQNLWADTFACLNALKQGDPQVAEKLRETFGERGMTAVQPLHEQFLHQIFISANNRIFAVIFWYMLLGPVGAVLYRVITLTAGDDARWASVPSLRPAACTVESWLNWLPVRLLTGIFALGGHFVQVFSCWRKNIMGGFDVNDQLLIDCGAAALGKEEAASLAEESGTRGRQAIALFDRTLIISLMPDHGGKRLQPFPGFNRIIITPHFFCHCDYS